MRVDLRRHYEGISLPLQTLKGNGVPSTEHIFVKEPGPGGKRDQVCRRKVLSDDEEVFAITDFAMPSEYVPWDDLKKAPVINGT